MHNSTPMTKNAEFSGDLKEAIAVAPMNRIGTSQEIADACLFLCSTKASFIQGTALIVSVSVPTATHIDC